MLYPTSFEKLPIWRQLGRKLAWYLAVATNRMPAKYLIAKRIPVGVDLTSATEAQLWREHERVTTQFLETWGKIKRGELKLEELTKESPSLIDLGVELVKRMLTHCNFCRWNCRVDRSIGARRGTCQLESSSRVSSYFHHRGEEAVFRGTLGSGTIFFTSCNLRCQFCQNGDISHDKDNGIEVTPDHLALMAYQLRIEGVHNINWVGGEPTIHLHNIVQAIAQLETLGRFVNKQEPYVQQVKADLMPAYRMSPAHAYFHGHFNVPMLWNSNFFMSLEAVKVLRCLMDVWLPDFKFGNDACSVKLSKTPWYMETVTVNHKLIYDWSEDMVIRHLIMPNHVECCTKPVLDWIAKNTPDAPVNIMDQYHPDYACDPTSRLYNPRYQELSRRPYDEEILESYRYARQLGLNFEALSYEKNLRGLTL